MDELFNLNSYVKKLTEEYPSMESVWLIGSRANNSANENSDWDLLIFANNSILESLKNDIAFNQPEVDLLIVYDGENFLQPWATTEKSGRIKSGNLQDWQWKELNASMAQYKISIGHKNKKCIEDSLEKYGTEIFYFDPTKIELNAEKIWPKETTT